MKRTTYSKITGYVCLTAVLLIVMVWATGLSACSIWKGDKLDMRILCAGSLMVPMEAVEKAFEAENPDIDVLVEGHGSIQVIRHVTEIFEEADVMAVADYSLIPMLMYNTAMPDSDEMYASWNVEFATNSLGIAYMPESNYADEINENNWYEIVSRPDVKLGLSDARLDACGYRAFMLAYLAEVYYGDDSIFKNVLGTFNPSVELVQDEKVTTVLVPELLRPIDERIILRGSSIRLIALLESLDIDYAFQYQSVATQHHFNFLKLPSEIGMDSMEKSEFYQQVRCKLDFHRFSSVQPVFTGQPILYGITIPNNAPHPDKAVEFIKFLLGPEGQQIFTQNHQSLTVPAKVDNLDETPVELRQYLIQG